MSEVEITSPGRTAEDEQRRQELVSIVDKLMKDNGWSKAEVGRRIDLAHGTFSQWHSGTYSGRLDTINERVNTWLKTLGAIEEVKSVVPVGPSFLKLDFSVEVERMLSIAQIMGTMVMVTAEAGMGKSTVVKNYVASHANSYVATMSPRTANVNNMLTEIAHRIGVIENSASKLVRAIAKRLRRQGDGTLLIIDEAQHLSDEAINQLRYFADDDECQCGIALVGNSATYSRFRNWGKNDKYSQLHRRIFKRMRAEQPSTSDAARFIQAWGITDPEQTRFLMGVAMKPGALGQVDMTIKLARMVAAGAARELSLKDLKAAWSNRDVELD